MRETYVQSWHMRAKREEEKKKKMMNKKKKKKKKEEEENKEKGFNYYNFKTKGFLFAFLEN